MQVQKCLKEQTLSGKLGEGWAGRREGGLWLFTSFASVLFTIL